MTPEFLEYELRRLDGVVAVSVDESAVTLLVDPSVDAGALRVVVAGMLAAAGVELGVTVLGGIGGPAVGPRRVAPVAVGAAAGIGVLAAAVAVAALTGALHLGAPEPHHQTATRPPAAATPLTTVPNFGPSTTLLPGAPMLGGGPAAVTGGTSGEVSNAGTSEAALGGAPAGPASAGPQAPPLAQAPAPPPLPGRVPGPVTDYTAAAPQVAPPAVWPVLPIDEASPAAPAEGGAGSPG